MYNIGDKDYQRTHKSIRQIKQLFALQAEDIDEESKTRDKQIEGVHKSLSEHTKKFEEKMYVALTE